MTSLTESSIHFNILHCTKTNKMREKYLKGDYYSSFKHLKQSMNLVWSWFLPCRSTCLVFWIISGWSDGWTMLDCPSTRIGSLSHVWMVGCFTSSLLEISSRWGSLTCSTISPSRAVSKYSGDLYFIYMSVCLSVCLSVCPSIVVSKYSIQVICLSVLCILSVCPSVFLNMSVFSQASTQGGL